MNINEALSEFFKEEDFYTKVIHDSCKLEKDEKFDEYIKNLDNMYGDSLEKSIQDKIEKTVQGNYLIESLGV